jgi:hypothetical protein
MLQRFLLLLVLLCSGAAGAQSLVGGPAPGLWWNPDESGRGFTIDMQDSIMVVTSYVYSQQGAATWYVSAGQYNFATRTFTATFDANTGGQCLGCPYVRPQGVANAAGPIRIVFDSYTSGTLYYNGGSFRIIRQLYGYGDKLSMMRGSFVLSFNSALVISDWLIFDRYYQDANGRFVAGNAEGFPTTRVAVGSVMSTGESAFLVRVGDFYDFFVMTMDDHRLIGRGWTYRVGSNPVGSGSSAYGVRMKTPKEVGATASSLPADPKHAAAEAILREAAAKSSGEAAPAELVQVARELEAQLR